MQTQSEPLGGCAACDPKKHVAKKQHETQFLSNGEIPRCIEYYLERETADARKQVEDTEAAVQQEQDDTRKAENAGLTNTQPEKTFQILVLLLEIL
jgi:hypothetical protein